jgi:zinc transporter 2
MIDEQKDMYNEDKALFLIEQNDENYVGYRKQLEEVNNKVIKKLMKVSIFCIVFMTIEFIGGYIARSLAIMTDAAHLLSDLSGFVISMFSLYIALRPANFKLTYGYHRAEVIGALSSILIIWVLTIWLIVEACYRFYYPERIDGLVMMCIASCGLLFNLIMSKILMSEDLPNAFEHGHDHDESKAKIDTVEATGTGIISPPSIDENENPILRAAFIHILGDIIQSAGVLVASIIIYFYQDDTPGIVIVDPICTFIFAIIVLSTSIPISKDCINVLMEASPKEIDSYSLMKELSNINGVINIHDIHIWCISVGKPSISLHILSDSPQKSLEEATKICKRYGIFHATIQVEDNTQRRRESFMHCTHTYDNTIH